MRVFIFVSQIDNLLDPVMIFNQELRYDMIISKFSDSVITHQTEIRTPEVFFLNDPECFGKRLERLFSILEKDA